MSEEMMTEKKTGTGAKVGYYYSFFTVWIPTAF